MRITPILILLGALVLMAAVLSSGGTGFLPALLIVTIVGVPAVVAATTTAIAVQVAGRRLGYSGPLVLGLGTFLGVFGAAPLAGGAAFYLAAKLF